MDAGSQSAIALPMLIWPAEVLGVFAAVAFALFGDSAR